MAGSGVQDSSLGGAIGSVSDPSCCCGCIDGIVGETGSECPSSGSVLDDGSHFGIQ